MCDRRPVSRSDQREIRHPVRHLVPLWFQLTLIHRARGAVRVSPGSLLISGSKVRVLDGDWPVDFVRTLQEPSVTMRYDGPDGSRPVSGNGCSCSTWSGGDRWSSSSARSENPGGGGSIPPLSTSFTHMESASSRPPAGSGRLRRRGAEAWRRGPPRRRAGPRGPARARPECRLFRLGPRALFASAPASRQPSPGCNWPPLGAMCVPVSRPF